MKVVHMMKRHWKWLVPGCILAAAIGPVYRWLRPAESAVTTTTTVAAQPLAAHAKLADKEHEIAVLHQDLEKNPDHVPVLLRLAQMSREVGRTPDSIEFLRKAIAREGDNRDARLELGRSLFETGDVEGAIRETSALLERDPKDVDALYNLGAIYGNLGQDNRAREYWKRAVEAAPDSDSGKRASTGLKQLAGFGG
jgi:tetratricopeptide (TPR) repeat protein